MENVTYIFAYNFANVGMKPVCKGWNIFVHLYNKKVLKYGEWDVVFVNLVWVILELTLISMLIDSGNWNTAIGVKLYSWFGKGITEDI